MYKYGMGIYKVKLEEFEYKMYKRMMFENAESDSQKLAIEYAVQHANMTEDEAKNFIKQKFRMEIQYLNGNSRAGKFTLGAFRLFLDMTTQQEKDLLSELLEKICADEETYKKYNKNLNSLDLQDLETEVNSNFKGTLQPKSNMTRGDYTIVKIKDFEHASQYGKYTSWCVTHDERMFNKYTSNGSATFYFLLKDGFENVENESGRNTPFDKYGLSMIAVCVNYDGKMKTCTCRWNHNNGGNDHIMTTNDIEALIGKDNAYEVFVPNENWTKAKAEIQKVKEITNYEDLDKIFDYNSPLINSNNTYFKCSYKKNDIKLVCLVYVSNEGSKIIAEDIHNVCCANKDLIFIDKTGEYNTIDIFDMRIKKYLKRNVTYEHIDYDYFTYISDETNIYGGFITKLYTNAHGFVDKDVNGEEIIIERTELTLDNLLAIISPREVDSGKKYFRLYDVDNNKFISGRIPYSSSSSISNLTFQVNDNYIVSLDETAFSRDVNATLVIHDIANDTNVFQNISEYKLIDKSTILFEYKDDDIKLINFNDIKISTNELGVKSIEPNGIIGKITDLMSIKPIHFRDENGDKYPDNSYVLFHRHFVRNTLDTTSSLDILDNKGNILLSHCKDIDNEIGRLNVKTDEGNFYINKDYSVTRVEN